MLIVESNLRQTNKWINRNEEDRKITQHRPSLAETNVVLIHRWWVTFANKVSGLNSGVVLYRGCSHLGVPSHTKLERYWTYLSTWNLLFQTQRNRIERYTGESDGLKYVIIIHKMDRWNGIKPVRILKISFFKGYYFTKMNAHIFSPIRNTTAGFLSDFHQTELSR